VLLVWWLDSWVWKANEGWFVFALFSFLVSLFDIVFFFPILFYNWFLMVSYFYRVIPISSARLQVSRVT
jgi:hypothetical protein